MFFFDFLLIFCVQNTTESRAIPNTPQQEWSSRCYGLYVHSCKWNDWLAARVIPFGAHVEYINKLSMQLLAEISVPGRFFYWACVLLWPLHKILVPDEDMDKCVFWSIYNGSIIITQCCNGARRLL